MTPVEIIQAAQKRELVDDDGEKVELNLLPPLKPAELEAFAERLPCPLPGEIRELLQFCTGFEGTLDQLDFTGRTLQFSKPEIFPHGLPIAHDGLGNYWVVDLLPDSTDWAPIYFHCRDEPIMLLQSNSLVHFLDELFRMLTPAYSSLIDEVHEDHLFEVWKQNPNVLNQAEAAASGDPELRVFAQQLEPNWGIIDLRQARIGMGFSWGRYGPHTEVRRDGSRRIFAYRPPVKGGLLARLFGG